MITEPMKAPREPLTNFATLQFPVKVSYKEDGIRCLTHPDHGPISRSFKPIRNKHINDMLTRYAPSSLDGEIVCHWADGREMDFNATQSSVMSYQGKPDFTYRVFDSFLHPNRPFLMRMVDMRKACANTDQSIIQRVTQVTCDTPKEVQYWHDRATAEGKEGLIVRSMTGRYKSGRTTEREGILFKCVTFIREEAVVVGFEPMQTNCNVANADAFGRTKRSKHAAGMVDQPLLGAFICKHPTWGEFRVSGFTMDQRDFYWKNQDSILWQTLTFKYKPHGSKDAPRSPIFVGFRSIEDL